MPAPTLVSLCTKACIKNVRNLTDVGDFEYNQIRPVLAKIQSPEQLRQIELASPQICGEAAELWKAFIARDIPDWQKKNYAPKDPSQWYLVYRMYKKEQQKEIDKSTQMLRDAMNGIKKRKENHVSKVVEAKYLPKLPRDPRMMPNNGGVPINGARKQNGMSKMGSSVLTFSAGSKTKMTDGKSVFTRARREAREMSARNKLATPTHALASRATQVVRAPQGMVNEYRKAAEPAVKRFPSTDNKPHLQAGISNRHGLAASTSLEEREQRLRAMKQPAGRQKRDSSGTAEETIVDLSSQEFGFDSDEDDIEALFNERISKPAAKPRTISSKISPSPPPPPPPISRTGSPMADGIARVAPRPMAPIRKRPVDIFNRGASAAKRQRTG